MSNDTEATVSRHSLKYENGGEFVIVTVPWGYQTGLIPPPVIQFGDRRFVYHGDAGPAEATA